MPNKKPAIALLALAATLPPTATYAQSDSGGSSPLAGLIALAIISSVWGTALIVKGRREKEEERERLEEEERQRDAKEAADRKNAAKILYAERGSYIRGHRIKKDLGWISCRTDLRSDAEKMLKAKAGELGANAIIDLYFTMKDNEYTGDIDGEPYTYTNREKMWEGRAVYVEAETAKPRTLNVDTTKTAPDVRISNAPAADLPQTSSSPKPLVTPNFLAIDGNNLLLGDGTTARPEAIRALLHVLSDRGIKFLVFFDASVPYKILGNNSNKSELSLSSQHGLAKYFNTSPELVALCPAGEQADIYILDFAGQHSGHVLSRDQFRQYWGMYPWAKDPNHDRRSDRVIPFQITMNSLSIPHLGIHADIRPFED